jgi:hypothetical protein
VATALFRALADAVVLVHFGFLVYLVIGGFLGWRWPAALIPHAFAGAWGFAVVAFSLTCPLTVLEHAFRRLGHQGGSAHDGFIDRYVQGVIYPARYTDQVRVVVAIVVVASWAGALWQFRARHTGEGR